MSGRFSISSAGGRKVVCDTVNCELLFESGEWQYRVPLSSFFRLSSDRPWSFPERHFDKVRAAAEDDMLIAAVGNDEFVCGFSFHFEEELLKGDLLLTFNRESGYDFAAVALPVEPGAVFTFPGVLYNDNPSMDPKIAAPHFPSAGKASLMLEESRLPITGVNAEYNGYFISLFSVPEGGIEDEWTLGGHREGEKTMLMLASGCCSFNGVPDHILSAKRFVSEAEGVYRKFRAGEQISKRFAISWGEVSHKGHGFRDLAKSGYQLLSPHTEAVRSRDEVIALKMTALRERWSGNGYVGSMPGNLYKSSPKYLYGWTGQSFRLALCDMRYNIMYGGDDGIQRMYRCVDFFLKNGRTAVPGLYYTYFHLEDGQWSGTPGERQIISSRALGETWSDLGRIISCCRKHEIPEPPGAFEALREGLEFILAHRLPSGAVPLVWNYDGVPDSDEITCAGSSVLNAFLEMWQLTGEERWKNEAEKMLDLFWEIGGDEFDTPFAHATLDAACEDKEAGIPFFVAAARAYELTGDEKFRMYAETAADWLLTWVYFHEVPMREDSVCAKKGFKVTGWPSVSVEHHHLDVFFVPLELYKFGCAVGSNLYRSMARTVFKAWSHGISSGGGDWMFQQPGRQAEQFFQTRWFFFPEKVSQTRWDAFAPLLRYQMQCCGYTGENMVSQQMRGGCNPWDVAWIIALVLDAALGFEEEERKNQD